jgi:3-deoxy-manno-octulosonate cytidylyltransferase (CMP-KDO synthetase)
MATLLVIPARYGSTRFPGKPLAMLAGKPMLQWTWEAARRVPGNGRVIIATDDERIAKAARAWSADVAMTDPDCPSGSDRCAEVLRNHEERSKLTAEYVVNIQGDEPFLDPEVVSACLELLEKEKGLGVATPITPIIDAERFHSPHVVKALPDERGRALLFSRSPIPCEARTTPAESAELWRPWLEARGWTSTPDALYGFKHLGLYAFRRDALLKFVALAPSRLEKLEKLEQLRLMENGVGLGLVPVTQDSIGIDTPDDLERAEPFARDRLARLDAVGA